MRKPTCVLAFALVSHSALALAAAPHKSGQKHHASKKGEEKESTLLSRSARAMDKQEHHFLANKAEKLDVWRKIWGIPKPPAPQQPQMASKALTSKSKGPYPPFVYPVYGFKGFQPNPIAPLATAKPVAPVAPVADSVKPKIVQYASKSPIAVLAAAPPKVELPTVGPQMVGQPRAQNFDNDDQKQTKDAQESLTEVQVFMSWWKRLPSWRQQELQMQIEWNNENNQQKGIESAVLPIQKTEA